MRRLLKLNQQVTRQQLTKINLIIGKGIQVHYFQKILLMMKTGKLKKRTIIVREKWMKEDQNKDKKK